MRHHSEKVVPPVALPYQECGHHLNWPNIVYTSLVPRSPPQLLLQYCKWQGAGWGLGTRLNKPNIVRNRHIQTVHVPSWECMSHHKYYTLRWWRHLVSCSQTYTVLQGVMGWGSGVYLRLGHSWMYCQDNICSYVTAWITHYKIDG